MRVESPRQRLLRQSTFAVFLGISSTSALSLPAQALTLQDAGAAQLEFLDPSGALVGSGGITYQPFSGRFVQIQGFGVYESPNQPYADPPVGPNIEKRYTPPPGYQQVSNLTVNLSAFGVNFSSSNLLNQTGQSVVGGFVFFWAPPQTETFTGGPTGTLFGFGGGNGRSSGSGFFTTEGWLGGPTRMAFYNLRSDGTWSYTTISGMDLNGTWRAVAVPEPTTIVGTAAAALAIWNLKQKQRQGARKAG